MFYKENGFLNKKRKKENRLLKRPKRKDLGFKPKRVSFFQTQTQSSREESFGF